MDRADVDKNLSNKALMLWAHEVARVRTVVLFEFDRAINTLDITLYVSYARTRSA